MTFNQGEAEGASNIARENLAWSAIRSRWRALSIIQQFFAVCAVATFISVIGLGYIVGKHHTQRLIVGVGEIEASFVRELLQPLVTGLEDPQHTLAPSHAQALDNLVTGLHGKIRSMRIWRLDGRLVYSTEPAEMGRARFPQLPPDALADKVHVHLDHSLATVTREQDREQICVFTTISHPEKGAALAVAEVHTEARNLEEALRSARLLFWLALAATAISVGAFLSFLFFGAQMALDKNRKALADSNIRMQRLAARSERLRLVSMRAHARAAAVSDQASSDLGLNLHDGPLQILTLAILKLSSMPPLPNAQDAKRREVQKLLQQTLTEIRDTLNNIILPDIDAMTLNEVIQAAVSRHQLLTGVDVNSRLPPDAPPVSRAIKLTAYRVVQEGLNNGYKHAGGNGQAVEMRLAGVNFEIEISDRGATGALPFGGASGLGIHGLRTRVAAMGGYIHLSRQETGSCLKAVLPQSYDQAPWRAKSKKSRHHPAPRRVGAN